MELTLQQALKKAVEAHKTGKLGVAEKIYRAILQVHPDNPDANHNLGAIANSAGKAPVALTYFKKALKYNPSVNQYWLSYFSVILKTGFTIRASTLIEEAIEAGVEEQIIAAMREQLSNSGISSVTRNIFPSDDILQSLNSYLKAGELTVAEELATLVSLQYPKHFFAWKVLGAVYLQRGFWLQALQPNQKAVAYASDDQGAHNNLGVTLQQLSRFEEAAESYRAAVSLNPKYADALCNLGIVLIRLNKFIDAEKSFKQVLALKPDDVEVHTKLGDVLRGLGRNEEAINSYSKAIELNPKYAEAHRMLASIKTFKEQDEQFTQMLELYSDKNCSDAHRCQLSFGLAKAFEDVKAYKQAFTYYLEGNRLRKKQLNYDISKDMHVFERLKSAYADIEKLQFKCDDKSDSPTPIFILGMPRSGTTLAEQIISSHSSVTGAGELAFVEAFGHSLAMGVTKPDKQQLANFRQKYLGKLEMRSEGKAFVTDKAPLNFRYIGLIAAAFPEAKIIHLSRNPAAVCWGNYKMLFDSNNIGFCYDLDDVVKYYKLTQQLMMFWQQKFGDRIYNLDYELLTVEQEQQSKNLLAYLDLEWDDSILSPQKNKRSVYTASNLQVRSKVYQGSSEKWKHYKPFLNDIFDQF